jgi:hypothetical protein
VNPTTAFQKTVATPVVADHTAAWLDFWSKILAAWAWPIGAIVLALIFAPQIRKLVENLARLKLPGLELVLREKAAQLAEQTEPRATEPISTEAIVGLVQGVGAVAAFGSKIWDAWRDPVLTVQGAWSAIEQALREAAGKHGLDVAEMPLPKVEAHLLNNKLITLDTLKNIQAAREFQSLAQRDPGSLQSDSAALYLSSSRRIVENIGREAGMGDIQGAARAS